MCNLCSVKSFGCILILYFSSCQLQAQEWVAFEKYHETISRKEFCRLVDQVYNPSKIVYDYLNIADDFVEFFEDTEKSKLEFTLRFANPEETPRKPSPHFKTIPDLRRLTNPKAQPLRGIRIVVDPGHIGGVWSDTENRSVIWGNNPIIREGDKNLQVGKLLKARLETAGAEVYITHEKPEPTTSSRPQDFLNEARQDIYTEYKVNEETAKARHDYFEKIIGWRADLYFYRRAEITQRAENIRAHFLPDLNICNHFNATETSGSGKIVKDNRHVFFINGCYGPDEVVNPMTRFLMFSKLLEQSLEIEIPVADAISKEMLKVANLPAVNYGREKYKCRVNDNPYLYARNLAASRRYPGPCVVLEPFYMNNAWTAARLAAGDYDGIRPVAGGNYRSIFREYSDAVADAIIKTYSQWIRWE